MLCVVSCSLLVHMYCGSLEYSEVRFIKSDSAICLSVVDMQVW